MPRNRSHDSTAPDRRTRPTPRHRHRPVSHNDQLSDDSASSSSSPPLPAPAPPLPPLAPAWLVDRSLSSFVLSAPSSAVVASSASSPPSLSLPAVLQPFQRPFSSLQRGLYHQLSWPLHCTAHRPRDGDTSTDELTATATTTGFVPPHFDLSYTPSSSFQIVALPAFGESTLSASSMTASSTAVSLQQSHHRLPLWTRGSAAAANAPPAPAQSTSPNALLVLTVHDGGENWHVIVFATGDDLSSVALLTLPAHCLLSPPPVLSSSDRVTLSADLLHSASPLWRSAAADSAIVRIECCDSPPLPLYPSLAALPLIVAHSEQRAVLYCITRRVAPSASNLIPLLRLSALDALCPFTAPLLCVAANHQLCSSTACEVAAVDAGGCVYLWTVDARTRIEQQWLTQQDSSDEHDSEGGEVDEAAELREMVESEAALDSRHVQLILRSSYEQPNHISALSSLSFARCFFAPHPRSMLLSLSGTLFVINIRGPRTDGTSDLDIDSRILPVPDMSAPSVPVNRYRRMPHRPQPIRDYFFQYQSYRAAQRTQQHSIKAEQPSKHQVQKDGDDGERSSATRSDAQSIAGCVKSGELLDAVRVPGFPFLIAILSSSFVQLIDIRDSVQPMVEWQHEQRYSSSSRPSVMAYTMDVGRDQRGGRHILLLISEAMECAVLLYHCVLGSAISSSAATAAAAFVTPQSAASPLLQFASMRLPSFGEIAAPSPSAFLLLPLAPQPLIGLSVQLSPIDESRSTTSPLPSFTLFQLSRSGALLLQRWTATGNGDLPDHKTVEASDAECGGEMDVENVRQLSRPVLSSVCGLLFPSDECAPAALRSAVVRRHDVLDLSAAMNALIHGRYRVQQRHRSAVHQSHLLDGGVLSALRDHTEQLQHWMTSPRSANELARYMTHERWIEQQEGDTEDELSEWHRQLAHSVYGILHGWMLRTEQQLRQEAGVQPAPLIFHVHPQQPYLQSPQAAHDQPLSGDTEAPFSLHRCRCEEELLRGATVQSTGQCCPMHCCHSLTCALADTVMFHSHEAVLPTLTWPPSGEQHPQLHTGDSGRVAAQQRMDLSQDVGTLMQLITQPASDILTHSLHGHTGGSKPNSNTRACDGLLASMSKQWQQWQQRAVDGSVGQEGTAQEVSDLDGGWRGWHATANIAASSGEGREAMEELRGWQELTEDMLDEEDYEED